MAASARQSVKGSACMCDRTPDIAPAQSDTMSLAELADRLEISITSAYAMANQNALPVPVFRVGRQFRVSRRAFDALLDAQHGAHAHREIA